MAKPELAVLKEKTIIGLLENVILILDGNKRKKLVAKIDTGATKSSIDTGLASELGLGPVIKSRMIKSAHGSKLRPVIEATIEIAGKMIRSEFTLADRTHLKFSVLIGQNILKEGFLIDPSSQIK